MSKSKACALGISAMPFAFVCTHDCDGESSQLLCTLVPNQISEGRVFDAVEKDSFIDLPDKGGHSG